MPGGVAKRGGGVRLTRQKFGVPAKFFKVYVALSVAPSLVKRCSYNVATYCAAQHQVGWEFGKCGGDLCRLRGVGGAMVPISH